MEDSRCGRTPTTAFHAVLRGDEFPCLGLSGWDTKSEDKSSRRQRRRGKEKSINPLEQLILEHGVLILEHAMFLCPISIKKLRRRYKRGKNILQVKSA